MLLLLHIDFEIVLANDELAARLYLDVHLAAHLLLIGNVVEKFLRDNAKVGLLKLTERVAEAMIILADEIGLSVRTNIVIFH